MFLQISILCSLWLAADTRSPLSKRAASYNATQTCKSGTVLLQTGTHPRPAVLSAAAVERVQSTVILRKRAQKVVMEDGRLGRKMMYYGEISVGLPAQQFVVVYDTGSGNLIVPGTECTDAACTTHTQFHEGRSTTAVDTNCDSDATEAARSEGSTLEIEFGTGRIEGRCIKDQVCMGSSCTTASLLVAVEESSRPFSEYTFDGVLGLAPEQLAHGPSYSIMGRFGADSVLKENLFGVFLSDSDAETSEITFGALKQDHMDSDIIWMDVNSQSGYWEVQIEDITLNDERQGVCENCRVAVDTGTSQLAGPSTIMTQIKALLQVASDCSNYDTLPNLGFIVSGVSLSLHPEDYVDKDESSSVCEVALMNLDMPPPTGPIFVFGIPFLQRYYTAYNINDSRIGFALARHNPSATRTAPVLIDTSSVLASTVGLPIATAARAAFLSPHRGRRKNATKNAVGAK